MTRKPPNCCNKNNLYITALLKTESPLIIPPSMNSGKKATLNPLTLDDVAFINQTQRSKRECKSERRKKSWSKSGVSDEFCSLFHPFN